jgi:hypothetical protein
LIEPFSHWSLTREDLSSGYIISQLEGISMKAVEGQKN